MGAKEKTRNPWVIVMVLVFATMICTFNETIINVALIPMSEDMGVSLSLVQWMITGYMLISTVMVPITAFLYQSIPTKRLCVGALGILFIGSVGCFFAGSYPLLLCFRMFQAVGASMMIPIMMSTALLVAPKEKIGVIMALCVCGTTLGPAFGPTISGLVMKYADWRTTYLLIAALVAVALVLVILAVDNVAEITKPKLDVLSIILSTAGLAAFLYGVSIICTSTVSGAVTAGIGLVMIAIYVRRQERLKQPMLNIQPFQNSMFTLGIIMVSMAMLVNFAFSITTPSFLQGAFGVSGITAALMLLPGVLLNVISTNISGKILDKHGAGKMIPLGFAVTAAAIIAFTFCGTDTSLAVIIVVYCLVYQGLAFTLSPSQTTALGTLSKEMNPHGVGIVNTFMQMSAGIASSLFGGIQAKIQNYSLASGASSAQAMSDGFHGALYAAIVISIIGLVTALAFSYRNKFNKYRRAVQRKE